MIMENITLVVNSCDKYEDLWDPFFTLLKKYWNPEMPIVLNTESKSYSYPGLDIHTLHLYQSGGQDQWSERLMRTLERINTDYILFMLDDFFIESEVNRQKIKQCLEWMKQDTSIAAFCFMPIMPGKNLPCGYPGFELRPLDGEYRLNCQAAIWNKKHLLHDMRPHESAWLFETLGSKRSRRYRDQKFYSAIPGTEVMEYNDDEGAAVHRGRWNQHTLDFLEKEGIHVDSSLRGINTDISGSTASKRKYFLSRLKPDLIAKAVINRWKSYK